MNIKNLECLQRLHQYITTENTGSPNELAKRLNISLRSLHRHIDQLKDIKAPICFCRRRKTYYYREDFDFLVNISVRALYKDEMIEIFGGGYSSNKNVLVQGFGIEQLYISNISF